jgi:hypothetical protein
MKQKSLTKKLRWPIAFLLWAVSWIIYWVVHPCEPRYMFIIGFIWGVNLLMVIKWIKEVVSFHKSEKYFIYF